MRSPRIRRDPPSLRERQDMGKLGEPLAPRETKELGDFFAVTPGAKPLDWVHGSLLLTRQDPERHQQDDSALIGAPDVRSHRRG